MATCDWVKSRDAWYRFDTQRFDFGSALVREINAVPLAAPLWLFGSGLFGLFEFARPDANT